MRDRRACCSVLSTSQATRNLSFLEVSAAPSRCCFKSLFMCTGTGCIEILTEWELVQTCTRTWWWCVSMFGARFAVFARRARVLPSRSQATRNLSFLVVSPAPITLLFQVGWCTGLVRVGLNFPLNGTCANVYAHVVVVREHAWRTLCSVCATGAGVAQSFPSNS